MTLGSAAHSVILEQSWEPIVFVDAPNFTTKDARLQRDTALAAGLLPLLEKDRATVDDMVLAIHNAGLFDASMRELSQFEATLCWREGPSWHRCRVDCIYRGEDGEPDTLYDLKTTAIDATPDGWGRSAIWDYALQAAWYTRGYEELTGRMANFVFVVQETKPPYGVRPFRFGLTGEAYGRDLADRAADLWARCMERGEWPSYPADVVTVQAPGWIAAQVGEGVRG